MTVSTTVTVKVSSKTSTNLLSTGRLCYQYHRQGPTSHRRRVGNRSRSPPPVRKYSAICVGIFDGTWCEVSRVCLATGHRSCRELTFAGATFLRAVKLSSSVFLSKPKRRVSRKIRIESISSGSTQLSVVFLALSATKCLWRLALVVTHHTPSFDEAVRKCVTCDNGNNRLKSQWKTPNNEQFQQNLRRLRQLFSKQVYEFPPLSLWKQVYDSFHHCLCENRFIGK